MKKMISTILLLGILSGIFVAAPVMADGTDGYPFECASFEDARDMATIEITNGAVAEWAEGGVGGSDGCLHIVQTADKQTVAVNITENDLFRGGNFKISAWVRVDTKKSKIKNTRCGFVLYAPAKDDANGTYSGTPDKVTKGSWKTDWHTANDRLNSGEWVYVETVVEGWDGTMRHGKFSPEEGDGKVQLAPRLSDIASGTIGSSLATDSPTKTLSWYVDDLTVEPIKEVYVPEVEEPETDKESVLCSADFSEGLSEDGILLAGESDYWSWNEDGYASMAKPTSGTKTYSQITLESLPVKYNKLYRFSFRMKADAEISVGNRVKVIGSRTGKTDMNDTNGKYQYLLLDKKLTTEWQEFEVYMKRNLKSYDGKKVSFVIRCVHPKWSSLGASDGGREEAYFSIDDVKVEEIDAPNNGDFEWLKEDIPPTVDEKDPSDSDLYGNFYAWMEKDVEVETSADVPAESIGNRSAKIKLTEENGSLYQGFYVENQTSNVIRFWAKGEGDTVGKTIQIKLDRTVPNVSEKDVYVVPDEELLGENLVLTDSWKEYAVVYEPSFAVAENKKADASVTPRQPFLSFVVNGASAESVYYLDDISMEPYKAPKPLYTYPYLTNQEISGQTLVGETVVVSYLYNNELQQPEQKTAVRVLKEFEKGNFAVLSTFIATNGTFAYEIPEKALGCALKFEMTPVAKDGTIGAVYSVKTEQTVKRAYEIQPTLMPFDETSGSITGKLTVKNNTNDKDMDVFLAIALYDAEGGMLRFAYKPLSTEAQAEKQITLTVSAIDTEDLPPIAYAEAYVWNGVDFFQTNLVSYTDILTVSK